MKKKLGNRPIGAFNTKRVLIGTQFFLLVLLCGFGFFLQKQIKFMKSKDLGFQTEGVAYFSVSSPENYQLIKQELQKNPNVLSVGSGSIPGNDPFNQITFSYEGVDEIFDDGHQIYIDRGMAETLGLRIEGFDWRNMEGDFITLLNETAIRRFEDLTGKSKNELINSQIIESPEFRNENGTQGFVMNVDAFVNDFNFFSLRESSAPFIVTLYKEMPWGNDVAVKLMSDNFFQTVQEIEKVYNQVETETPLEISFLDDRITALYSGENRVASLVSILAILSIILAYLGLVGITYYSAKTRQKEVAIRRVLGARMLQVLQEMSKEYFYTAIFCLILATPLVIYLANQWLENFAFKIDTEPFSIIAIGLIALAVMLSGVIWQSFNTAKVNPVIPLRKDG